MTLIVGLHLGTHVLLSSDSAEYDDITKRTTRVIKLDYASSLAWVFSGYEPYGRRFCEWMRAEAERLVRLRTWSQATAEIKRAVDEINAPVVERARAGGGIAEGQAFVHAVVAGFVGGEGAILALPLDPNDAARVVTRAGMWVAVPGDSDARDHVARAVATLTARGKSLHESPSDAAWLATSIVVSWRRRGPESNPDRGGRFGMPLKRPQRGE